MESAGLSPALPKQISRTDAIGICKRGLYAQTNLIYEKDLHFDLAMVILHNIPLDNGEFCTITVDMSRLNFLNSVVGCSRF